MTPENYFLRYAFPCASIVFNMGEIDKEKFDELQDIAVNDKPISRDELEKIFFRAFSEIKVVAEELGKDVWDIDVIKEYFHKRHNINIDAGKSIYKHWPESLRELSKVFKAKVLDKKDGVLVVEYDGKKRNVLDIFVKQARINDFVMIHYGYAVELFL